MRTEVIKADSIDAAVEGILNELKDTSRRENFIYFDGWEGLGAATVLQALAQRLASDEKTRPPGLLFEQVIHIDCSKWESTRAVQKEIAKHLKLPSRVIDLFDKQDEEDDFNGITDQGSRTEIPEVAAEIERRIQGRRFLLVFHNGGNEEVNIADLGLSIYGYLSRKMVWTFQGRFRIDTKMREMVIKKNTTDVLLSASRSKRDPEELWSYLLHEEATQVVCKHGVDPAIAVECFLYMLTLNCIRGHHVKTEFDLATHTCNYWICDGIIKEVRGIDEAWQVGDTLQGEIRCDIEYCHNELPSHLVRHDERIPHWSSPANGFLVVPAGVIPNGMFQHFDKLGVLKLFKCTFSFSSPPFLYCHVLRFLWLENCQDLRNTDAEKRDEEDTTSSWACFQGLWVLDLRYTDCDRILSARVLDLMTQLRELNVMGAENWDMSHLRGRLCNIHKLRVTKSTCFFNNNMFSDMESMELLDFSGNHITQGMKCLSGSARNSNLKSVIIDGCDGLKNISFRGCKELANLLLKGSLEGLEQLELSGTRVKTLNLTGVEARSLPKQIIMLGCDKLRAILWPPSVTEKEWPKVLHIDTTSPSATAYGGEAPLVHPHADRSLHQQKEEMFKGGWRISVTDARLLRSLSRVRSYLEVSSIHIDICHAATDGGSNIQGTSSDTLVQIQPHTSTIMDSKYRDVLKDGPVAAMMMWDCPKIHLWKGLESTCIIKVIMHGQGNRLLEGAPGASTSTLLLPNFICEQVTSLHVYDNPSITSIPVPPQGSGWICLIWCRIERCPELHTVFNVTHDTIEEYSSFWNLRTLWASELLSALYIWDRPVEKSDIRLLELLHLDHCPRLVHVLPFSMWTSDTLSYLKTLEIVCCGDLREVFPLSPEIQEQDTILHFPNLRRVHLHELPMLQGICGRRISAPKLETIKIRGCWSLRRLPTVRRNTNPPKVDCEKEWWDNLEWDGLEKYHHPSLYEPSHSLYYKAQLPRGTVLR